jgi:hypothetical protein
MLQCGGTLRSRCSMTEADTQGPTGCDSIDRKHPELEDPVTGSGLWGPGSGEGMGDCSWGQGFLLG